MFSFILFFLFSLNFNVSAMQTNQEASPTNAGSPRCLNPDSRKFETNCWDQNCLCFNCSRRNGTCYLTWMLVGALGTFVAMFYGYWYFKDAKGFLCADSSANVINNTVLAPIDLAALSANITKNAMTNLYLGMAYFIGNYTSQLSQFSNFLSNVQKYSSICGQFGNDKFCSSLRNATDVNARESGVLAFYNSFSKLSGPTDANALLFMHKMLDISPNGNDTASTLTFERRSTNRIYATIGLTKSVFGDVESIIRSLPATFNEFLNIPNYRSAMSCWIISMKNTVDLPPGCCNAEALASTNSRLKPEYAGLELCINFHEVYYAACQIALGTDIKNVTNLRQCDSTKTVQSVFCAIAGFPDEGLCALRYVNFQIVWNAVIAKYGSSLYKNDMPAAMYP